VAVGLAAALAACSASAPAADDAAASPAPSPAPLEVAWTGLPGLASGPVDADGTAIAYVAAKKKLALVGLDPQTGDELWRQDASPAEIVPGIDVTPTVIDGKVVYFRPSDAGNLYAELVVADPATGEDVVVTDAMLFRSTPTACDDDATAVCVDARTDYDAERQSYRIKAAPDGELRPDEGLAGRPIGEPGMREVRQGSAEYLTVYEGGAELWRASARTVFGSGYSTDYGWRWDYHPATDRFYGEIGHEVPEPDADGTQVLDMADSTVVALDRATGDVAWREQGVSYVCNGSLAVPDPAADGEADVPLPVRCRTQGDLVYGGKEVVRDGIDVTIEGFDRDTGETTWQVHQGDTPQLLGGWTDAGEPPRLGESGVVVPVDGTPTVLDLATGETRPYDDEALWCDVERSTFDYHEPFYIDGEPQLRRYGGRLYSPCDATGEPLEGGDTARTFTAVPAEMSTQIGGTTLVGTPDGIVAYQ